MVDKHFFFFYIMRNQSCLTCKVDARRKSFKTLCWKFQSNMLWQSRYTLYIFSVNFPLLKKGHAFQLFQKWKYPTQVILKHVQVYKIYTQSNAESTVKCSIEVAQSTTQVRKFQKLMVHGLLLYNSTETILHSQNSLT